MATPREIDLILRLRDQLTPGFTKIVGSIVSAQAVIATFRSAINTLEAGFFGSIRAATAFESSFAGVRKTVSETTTTSFADLENQLRSLSTDTLPVSVNELNRVAEAAGQLGVGADDVIQFTEVMAKLGVTTNLSSDEAATAIARFANITGASLSDVDRLGSTIVALGNNLATTEAEITQFALRISGAGSQVGLSEDQILAFGGALSSVGINAEAGGTAISKVFIELAQSVAAGGEELQGFAKVAGVSVDEFRKKFQEDAAGATVAFIEGLGDLSDAGGNVFKVLEDLGLQEVRVRDALLRSAGAGDLLRKSLTLASDAFQENNALNKEAAERFKTFESQTQFAKNAIEDLQKALGDYIIKNEAVAEIIGKFRQQLIDMVDWLGRNQVAVTEFVNSGLLIAVDAFILLNDAIGKSLKITGAWFDLWFSIFQNLPIPLLVRATSDEFERWVQNMNSVIGATKSAGEGMDEFADRIASMRGEIEKATEAQLENAKKQAEIFKQNAGDQRLLSDLTKNHAGLITKATEEVTAAIRGQGSVSKETFVSIANALGGTSDAVDLAQEFFGELTSTIKEQEEAAKRLGEAVGKGGVTDDIVDLGDAVEKATEKLNAMAFAFDLSKERAKELADFNKQSMSQIAAFPVPEAPGGHFDVPAGTRGIFNVGRNIPTLESFGPIIGGIEDASRATTDWSKQLEDVANIMRVMGIESNSAFAIIIGGFIASSKAAADYEAAVSNVGKAQALATGAAVVWQQAGQEGAKGVLAGAASGAQLGFSVAGPWGAAAGAAAGAIISLIRNAGRTAKTVAEEVGRDLGGTISESLAQQIHESGQNVQLFLSEIFAEGGLSVDRFAEEIGDLFSVLERGEISASDALIAFTSDVSILMEHLHELGAVGQEQLERIIEAARSAGPEFAAIADELERAWKLAGFAANTIEEIMQITGLTREEVKALAEEWGVKVLPNFRKAAIEAGLTKEQMRFLRDYAKEAGISMDELLKRADALGIPLGTLVANLGGPGGATESTATLGEDIPVIGEGMSFAADAAGRFAQELERAAIASRDIRIPSVPGGVPDVSAQGGFFSHALPRDMTIRAHRGERVDIGHSSRGVIRSGGVTFNMVVNVSGAVVATPESLRRALEPAMLRMVKDSVRFQSGISGVR